MKDTSESVALTDRALHKNHIIKSIAMFNEKPYPKVKNLEYILSLETLSRPLDPGFKFALKKSTLKLHQ